MKPISRSKSAKLLVLLLLACALPCGCGASERMLAGRRDYSMYREFRLAENTPERLRHANRYLKDLPDGRFRGEVALWFARKEPAFFEAARDRPSLLRAYLAALPDGPHAEQVIDRMVELDSLREYRASQTRLQDEKIDKVGSELERARQQREAVVRSLTELVRLLSDIRSFGSPTEDLDHQLLFALRLRKPAMRCDAERCKKSVRMAYSVPEAKRLAAREALFEVELDLEQGLVRAATLRGPQLFSRLFEASAVTPVTAGDFAARLDAISGVTTLVHNLIEERLPVSTCGREVVAPVVLWRECDGIRLELVAGGEPDEPDLLSVRSIAHSDSDP